ncbi:MAG: hydroxymethylglutaryl-CoA lyase [Alphaproteobacteria bacterium]|nr:hydroxymethylglutaryl-CoA lyase [Alphaproteobacteria bacterium]OJV46802.1 MAG: hydroxymethylglutaryl-CoA lyase [Alphaproteobacteria bacterium 43-37]
MTSDVQIVEVGPRDGLQAESTIVPADLKALLIEKLHQAKLSRIELGSFVSPRSVPQMASTSDVINHLKGLTAGRKIMSKGSVLVANQKGLDAALESGATHIAVFTAASDAFTLKNINGTIQESLDRFAPLMAQAKTTGISVRGYISCVIGCPYQGPTSPSQVVPVAEALLDLGCDEISLGDTIGVGTPAQVKQLLSALQSTLPLHQTAVHFHDTYGQALVNILTAIELGVKIIDSSIAGLGGCPYAPGSSGNVATEDVVYMLNGMGIETGIDVEKLLMASRFVRDELGLPIRSKAALALTALGH